MIEFPPLCIFFLGCMNFIPQFFYDDKSSIMQIYVVDSLDRERIDRAKAEFQV